MRVVFLYLTGSFFARANLMDFKLTIFSDYI